MEGVHIIFTLLDLFFISFIFNIIIIFYTIYTFFQFNLSHSSQGSKLELKLRKEEHH